MRSALIGFHTSGQQKDICGAIAASVLDSGPATIEKPESQHQATDSMRQSETTAPTCSINVDEAALCELFNQEVEH